MRTLLAAALLVSACAPASAAQVRNFFSPVVEGVRVDACLEGGECGKPAADAFCRAQGYDHAMIFQRERFSATRMVDTGKACSEACTAFRQVKCFTVKSDMATSTPAGL